MSTPVRILILGTGSMAHQHVKSYQQLDNAIVVAGVDSRPEVLDAFCTQFGIEHQFNSLSDALAWGDFDASSNVTPDGAHHETTLTLLDAGKHVLCEKPLATNAAHANEMAQKADHTGLVNMVNLSYREVPAMQRAAEMVANGAIGNVRHFEASYLQSWLTQPAWGDWKTEHQWLWRLSTSHGSNGVLGDVGIHILDFVTYVAQSMPAQLSSKLKTFDKAPDNKIGEYTLDANDSFVLNVELENGALGTISATRFASGHHNDLRLRIYGDKGGMEVLFEKGHGKLNVCLNEDLLTEKWAEVDTVDLPNNYARFIDAVQSGLAVQPDFQTGAQLQYWLDQAK